MQLRELKLSGFKSFAKSTRLVFGSGITAIIGPNGQGKSNLSDSIRWVLGEQSLKNLRGKSSTDIIFSGSESEPRKGSATASLLLLNEDERLPVPAAEVLLERSIDRSGESSYLLNGDPVRLLDVHHMLAVAGLGTRSYAVISQGTVDQYLTASPKGRRELFDEATGVKALQIKLRQAEGKLLQARERAGELQAVIQEIKPRLAVLQRQVNRHNERQELEQVFRTKQEQWYHGQWHSLMTLLQNHQATVQQLEIQVLNARQARERAEADMVSAAQGQASRLDDESVARQQRERELLEARQTLEREQQRYQDQTQERAELTSSLERIGIARRDAERHLAQVRSASDTDTFFVRIRDTLTHTYQALTAWRQQAALNEEELDTLDEEIRQLLHELEHEERTVLAATSLIERLEGPLQAVARLQAVEEERRQRLNALPEPHLPDTSTVERLTRLLEESSHEAQPAHHQLETFKERLGRARDEEVEAERQLSVAHATLLHAKEALASHEADIRRDLGTTFLHHAQATEPAETAATAEELQRVAGRLAALGEIDPLALQEFEETQARYLYLTTQLDDVLAAQQKTEQLIRTLKRTIETQFREQFRHIRQAFSHLFSQLFGGGSATLEIVEVTTDDLEDSDESAQVAGVEILARPPGKKPAHIGLLSGGERALTSLALVLAIMQVQRPPFLVLDEVDAALDEANSSRFAQLLQEFKKHTQVIIITHNRETMGQADVLYGVTMHADGVSRVYSVKMDEIAETESLAV